jgi:hypothetical protein
MRGLDGIEDGIMEPTFNKRTRFRNTEHGILHVDG